MVKRLNRYHQTTGHVETVVGVVNYGASSISSGTKVELLVSDKQLSFDIAPSPQGTQQMIADHPDSDEARVNSQENAWEFTGPNSMRYKWQMFCHSPVLIVGDNSFTPLARYRRAKVGIVSRARRAFLEILPAGLGILDLIVVTFVGFMRQRVMAEAGPTISTIHDNFVTAAFPSKAEISISNAHSQPNSKPSSSHILK